MMVRVIGVTSRVYYYNNNMTYIIVYRSSGVDNRYFRMFFLSLTRINDKYVFHKGADECMIP